MQTFYAIDLVPNPKYRKLWCRHGKQRAFKMDSSLPKEGVISPAGFYLFHETPENRSFQTSYSITFNQEKNKVISHDEKDKEIDQGKVLLQVNFKKKDLRFSCAITSTNAHLTIDPQGWERASEAILMIVTQCWRFYLIEEALDFLFEASQEDLNRTSSFTLRDWKYRKRFASHDLELRKLSQDIPHFEGLSVDPYRHCKDEQSTEIYQKLAEKLDMEGWCSSINDRIEILSDTYANLLEKLFYHKQFVSTLVIEVLIVLLLLGELLAILGATL